MAPGSLHETALQGLQSTKPVTQLLLKLRDPEVGLSADRLDSCSARRCDPLQEPSCQAQSRRQPIQRSPSIRRPLGSCWLNNAALQAADPLSTGTALRKRNPSSSLADH